MNYEQEMLELERTRLEMEKRRDRNASIRFLIGSILLVAGTTGASLFVNYQQGQRSLASSERQWVIPMLMQIEPTEFDVRIERIDALSGIELTRPMQLYLSEERIATVKAKNEFETKQKEEQAALKEQELQEKLAKEAEERAEEAKQLAQLEKQKQAEEEAMKAKAAAEVARQKAVAAEKERAENMRKEINSITKRMFKVF